jgi:Ca-activated chloride channel homolog
MKFAQLYMLHIFWGIIVLVLFLLWSKAHRKNILRKFSQEHLVEDIAFSFDARKSNIKNVLLMSVLILSILALMRPQWGFQWQEVKRQGIDILIVLDTSKSMLTQDVKPNRLERTKFAVKDLLKRLKGDRIGLIAFAGEPFLICPLTVDYHGFQISLNDLDVNTVPKGGTNLSKAISEAIKDYDKTLSKHKAIILITDGDNLEGDPIAVARKAKERGIKIYCVGIGSKEGELIQIRNEKGDMAFLKDGQGNFVKSRLNERLLQQIALITDGIYVKASGVQFGLDVIYDRELAKLEKRDIESKMEKRYYERFQIPLSLAFLLLFIETCIGTRRKN